jgi:hypothetical protein
LGGKSASAASDVSQQVRERLYSSALDELRIDVSNISSAWTKGLGEKQVIL